MRILQITSSVVCGESYVGKWFCSDSIRQGSDDQPVIRYLQLDGSWGRNTQYFDSEEAVNQAISKGIKPDFSITKDESFSRQYFRDLQEQEDYGLDEQESDYCEDY